MVNHIAAGFLLAKTGNNHCSMVLPMLEDVRLLSSSTTTGTKVVLNGRVSGSLLLLTAVEASTEATPFAPAN